MKTKSIIALISSAALVTILGLSILIGIDARAQGDTGGGADAGLSSGGSIIAVNQQTGPGFVISPDDVRDVVKAMDILAKFAPGDSDVLSFSGSTGVLIGYGTSVYVSPPPRTKAQRMRDDADNEHKAKLAEADRLEKEQADIKWAKGILQRWRDKQTLLDH